MRNRSRYRSFEPRSEHRRYGPVPDGECGPVGCVRRRATSSAAPLSPTAPVITISSTDCVGDPSDGFHRTLLACSARLTPIEERVGYSRTVTVATASGRAPVSNDMGLPIPSRVRRRPVPSAGRTDGVTNHTQCVWTGDAHAVLDRERISRACFGRFEPNDAGTDRQPNGPSGGPRSLR